MPQFEKHFTVGEANSLLPELRELLQGLQSCKGQLVTDLEQALPVVRHAKTNGGGREANPYLTDIHDLNARIRQLSALGIQLKDVDRGLVDFPAWREGREVFLCWHLGEDSVQYWHDLETGYGGRQAI